MDPGIESLTSTTFFGRRLTRRQIADVQETVALFPALSRNELSKTICEHLNWTTPKGDYRVAACLRMLEDLEKCGILTLPAKWNTASGPRRAIEHTERSDPGPQIACGLAGLEPLSLHLATEAGEVAEWNELVDRHHWLGCPRPFGPHLRWFILDREGRRLGCLLFEAAAKTLPARDAWVGWSEADRDRRLYLAVSNSRFIILPWVRVDNLASQALAMAVRRLADEWEQRHACRPVLCETFASSCFSMVQVGVKLLRRCFKRVFCVPLFSPQQFYIVQHLNVDPKPGIFGRSRGPGSPSASPRDVINPGEVRVFGFASVQSRP